MKNIFNLVLTFVFVVSLFVSPARAQEAGRVIPGLLTEAEAAKLYAPVNAAAAEAYNKSPEAKLSYGAWRGHHEALLAAMDKATTKPANVAQPLTTEAEPGGTPITPTLQSKAGPSKALFRPAVFQGSPRPLNVIIIHYVTIVTGVSYLPTVISYTKTAIEAGSKFQGTGAQGIRVNVIQTNTITGTAPTFALPHAGIYNTGLYTRLMDIPTIYSQFNLCSQFAAGTLDQVWIWSDGWSAPNQVEFGVNGSDWSFRTDLQNAPSCGRAGAFFSFVYVNNLDPSVPSNPWYLPTLQQAPHSFAHYVEQAWQVSKQWDYSVCDFVDGQGRSASGITGDTTYTGAYCPSRPLSNAYGYTAHPNASNGNIGMCGDVHFPLNITTLSLATDYDYSNSATVSSRCNTWQWGASPTPQNITCTAWQCDEYWWHIYWLQHLPSLTTNATSRSGGARSNSWDKIPSLIPVKDPIVRNDYDGDGRSDYAVYRPGDGLFYVKYSNGSGTTNSSAACAMTGAVPRTGFRPTGGYYLVYQSTTGNYYESISGACTLFNTISTGLTVGSAKFSYTSAPNKASDGWRYVQSTGAWTISYASGNTGHISTTFTLGGTGWVPAIADFDGDGSMDPAVYNSSTGGWQILNSYDLTLRTETWGWGSYIAVPADYDGDHKAEVTVWEPSTGNWYIQKLTVTNVALTQQFGGTVSGVQDIPLPADYIGDGYAHFAVWRPASGIWYVLNRDLTTSVATSWGGTVSGVQDVPMSGKPW